MALPRKLAHSPHELREYVLQSEIAIRPFLSTVDARSHLAKFLAAQNRAQRQRSASLEATSTFTAAEVDSKSKKTCNVPLGFRYDKLIFFRNILR